MISLLLACLSPAFADEAPPPVPPAPPGDEEPAPEEPQDPDDEPLPDAEGGFLKDIDMSKVPITAVAAEIGYGATMGGQYGGLVRAIMPHSSVEAGMGLWLINGGNLLSGGVSAHGYLRREAAGLYLGAGLSTLSKGVVATPEGNQSRLRIAPYLGVGWRQYVVDTPGFSLPITAGAGIWSRKDEYDRPQSGFFFELSVGGQANLKR